MWSFLICLQAPSSHLYLLKGVKPDEHRHSVIRVFMCLYTLRAFLMHATLVASGHFTWLLWSVETGAFTLPASWLSQALLWCPVGVHLYCFGDHLGGSPVLFQLSFSCSPLLDQVGTSFDMGSTVLVFLAALWHRRAALGHPF